MADLSRVLIIEDDGGIAAALEQALGFDGYEVRTESDGLAGFERLQSAPPPDVLLLDLALPGMGGREIVERLAGDARLRQLPIIVMTATSRADLLPRPDSYRALLRKPFDLDAVLRLVAEHASACA